MTFFPKRETQPCLPGSLPLWLEQGLLFMASSSPPLADSLRGSGYNHQDFFAAQQEVHTWKTCAGSEMGCGVRVGDGGSLVSSVACQLNMS